MGTAHRNSSVIMRAVGDAHPTTERCKGMENTFRLFYLVMLIPPVLVLGAGVISYFRHHRMHLYREDILTLATVPNSAMWIAGVWVPPVIPFAYISIGAITSLVLLFAGWRGRGAKRQCEIAFCLLYFGMHWLLYALAIFGGVPPI